VARRRAGALKIRRWALAAAFLAVAQQAEPATLELVPMVGFQFNGSKDLSGPRNNRMDLRNVALRGASLGYLNDENGELELSWTRAYSAAQIQRSGGAPPDRFDVRVEQFHVNGLYMFGSAPFQPFMLIGAGATRYVPTNNLATTMKFSFALGSGFKWLWTDHIGLRLDARWTPALALQGSHFFCDPQGACYTTEQNSYLSRVGPFLNSVEFTAGLLLRY